jgi:archaellum biogenesis protein FlaJ (TadC family)
MDLSPAHVHLMLNHIPVLGPFFLALLMILGLFRRSRELVRVALALTLLLPVATYIVTLAGEKAEHYVEDQAWFDEDRVHDHEEKAEAALIATGVAGALALVALWASRKGATLKPAMTILVLLATLVSAGLVALAALDGGVIRHEELRPLVQTIDV